MNKYRLWNDLEVSELCFKLCPQTHASTGSNPPSPILHLFPVVTHHMGRSVDEDEGGRNWGEYEYEGWMEARACTLSTLRLEMGPGIRPERWDPGGERIEKGVTEDKGTPGNVKKGC